MILGLLALLAALAVGAMGGGFSPEEVFQSFPTGVFITLFSVTLLIKLSEENGCFEKLTSAGIRLCRGHHKALPFLIFILSALLSAVGAGNIATIALVAPAALS